MTDYRLRFCPSPTGLPHVGMIRTALFNWAYARHTKGKLIFRIEDTDVERDSEESYNMIIDSLKWLGIDWDEGVDIGGPFGPYRQSERSSKHIEVAKKLVENGYAYYSYSNAEDIAKRNKAAGRPEQFGYDNYDRNMPEEEIEEFKKMGREPVIRFRMPDEDITFNDLVRGEITFKKENIPDYVIVRANGDPLYTLVNPIDDAMMEVNLVMRGEDILSSTPRQIALYRALKELGIAKYIPEFAHLPYVMGEGNKKLSKRDPESNLFLHRDNGMIPEGILNYLALLGWSISPDNDIFTMDEMIEAFDIRKVNPNPARFDQKKCLAINAEHIRRLDIDDLKQRLVPYLELSSKDFDSLTTQEQHKLTKVTPLIQTRIQVLSECWPMIKFLFIDDNDLKIDEDAIERLNDNYKETLKIGLELLKDITDWTAENIQNVFKTEFIEKMGIKPKFAFTPFQTAICGKRISPPLFESMEILGKTNVLSRIESLLNSKTF